MLQEPTTYTGVRQMSRCNCSHMNKYVVNHLLLDLFSDILLKLLFVSFVRHAMEVERSLFRGSSAVGNHLLHLTQEENGRRTHEVAYPKRYHSIGASCESFPCYTVK